MSLESPEYKCQITQKVCRAHSVRLDNVRQMMLAVKCNVAQPYPKFIAMLLS